MYKIAEAVDIDSTAFNVAGETGLEPATYGFGDRRSAS